MEFLPPNHQIELVTTSSILLVIWVTIINSFSSPKHQQSFKKYSLEEPFAISRMKHDLLVSETFQRIRLWTEK